MTAYTREELTRLERERYRRLLDSLRPGQWLDRLGQVRSGHPLNWDELLRLTAPSVDGPECERCGRSAWVPVTKTVTTGPPYRRVEAEEPRLLCKACGAERVDDRPEVDHRG